VISQSLISALLVWVAHSTGYAIPGTPPDIRQVPHSELEAAFCYRPCAILGLTTPRGTILLDDKLAVGKDPAATSILVHELTHFLQQASAEPNSPADCESWVAREDEAYDMQYRWLHETSPSIRVLSQAMEELGTHPFLLKCTQGNALINGSQP
jgi:hypothetical protein